MITAKFVHTDSGMDFDVDYGNETLKEGETYKVTGGKIYPYMTYVYLEGFEKPFNSVMFDFFKDGESINIVREKFREWNETFRL